MFDSGNAGGGDFDGGGVDVQKKIQVFCGGDLEMNLSSSDFGFLSSDRGGGFEILEEVLR